MLLTDAPLCCGSPMSPCVEAERKMQVSHWYCPKCGRDKRAIGRERMITQGDESESQRHHPRGD